MGTFVGPSRTVLLIIPDDGILFAAAGMADMLAKCAPLIPPQSGLLPYSITTASLARDKVARRSTGIRLMTDVSLGQIDPQTAFDTLVVAGAGSDPEQQKETAEWVHLAAGSARRVVSICSGTLILAQAGLLDGRRATTHWQHSASLARNYPRVKVEPDPIYIHDGPIWTSAGATAGLDLTLALIEDDLGPAIARKIAQLFVFYLRRPGGQSQFSRVLEHQAADPGPIRELQSWMLEHLDQDLSVEKMAAQAAMSPRNFSRVFTRQTGLSPARYVEQIRFEAARQRLEQGRETVDQVASVCGFGTALSLRRAFERTLNVSPSEYRERFGII